MLVDSLSRHSAAVTPAQWFEEQSPKATLSLPPTRSYLALDAVLLSTVVPG